MPNGKDTMAQAVYLAQLEAARGTCKCKVCRILRKGNKMMADQFLAESPANPIGKPQTIDLTAGGEEGED